jgi:ArsR family transcriptional regulator
VADLFDVLAEGTRRDILQLLSDKADGRLVGGDEQARGDEMSVGELVEKLNISQPTVSKHLKVLRDHGVVHVREDGQHRFYSLASEPLEHVEAWLSGLTPQRQVPGESRPDFPYVDLWPAGYQIGTVVGQLRGQLNSLLGRWI